MFIAFGCDDNPKQEGVMWLVNFLHGKTNANGTPARMSFFVNGCYTGDAQAGWNAAFADGHEIGNHTYSHFPNEDGPICGVDRWTEEITLTANELTGTKVGIPAGSIVGFRTPYLQYSPTATFEAIKLAGFKYDCSIEQGPIDETYDGTQCWWPYTLDNGSLDNPDVGNFPGLWEIPVCEVMIPTDSACTAYGLGYSLRDSIAIRIPAVGDQEGFNKDHPSITGLDYNLMLAANYGDSTKMALGLNGAGVDSTEYSIILRYNYELRKATGRAPLTFGIHSQFYISSWDGECTTMNAAQRQGVIKDFLNLVLADNTVRVVPYRDIIRWMENPVTLASTKTTPATLTIDTGHGSVAVSPVKASYAIGDTITLTATPAAGYLFGGFSGDATGTTATAKIAVTSTRDLEVGASFYKAAALRSGCDTNRIVDLLNHGSWSGDCATGSAVTKNPVVAGGVLTIAYTVGKSSTSPWIDMACDMPTDSFTSFAGLYKIRVTYKSAKEFILTLPQSTTNNDSAGYAAWQVTLPPTTGFETKEYTWDQFAQPGWKPFGVPLVLSSVTGIVCAPSFESPLAAVSDTIRFNEVKLVGLNPAGTDAAIDPSPNNPTPVVTKVTGMISRPSLGAFTRTGISFNLPTAGAYSFRLLSLDGRTLLTVPQTLYAAGTVRMPLSGLASGMYVSIIESAKANIVQRAILTR